jgi:hypothetical protein
LRQRGLGQVLLLAQALQPQSHERFLHLALDFANFANMRKTFAGLRFISHFKAIAVADICEPTTEIQAVRSSRCVLTPRK